jgi:hypothetical protein
MTERKYQTELIKRLEKRFPGCMVLKTEPAYLQGIPDLIILWGSRWAMLELKANQRARRQPNQNYYLDRLGEMSFSACIYPENEEEVLNALQQAFESPRRARISKSK